MLIKLNNNNKGTPLYNTHSFNLKIFSDDADFSKSLEVTFFSAAMTTPSLARMPRAIPAWEIASIAYSTWYKRPILKS